MSRVARSHFRMHFSNDCVERDILKGALQKAIFPVSGRRSAYFFWASLTSAPLYLASSKLLCKESRMRIDWHI
jgi:hypothetical protein